MSGFEKKYFKTNVLIKNIIGKELINDDNVAVMELVKNSYDAGASKVIIEFKNIFSQNKISELIIQDNGCGMNEDDILNKWLNIAYSSKKTDHTQNNRYQAGNKGVGRFSCDRLGEELNIYTRKKDEKILHLKINWKDFELIDEIDTQIQDIPVYIRTIEDENFKQESGFEVFKQGTILQIQHLNGYWLDIEAKNSLFKEFEIDKSKLLNLKKSLERLVNPNQQYDNDSFKIYLKVPELQENNNEEYHKKVTGEIKNQIFNKLNFKTTFIESYITEDGSKIVTELKDKNKTIFRLIEKNTEFPLLKDIKIVIYYLNPYAKGFFTKQTGMQPVEFGSVFLFINGFRIPPYGDRENDSLGLEVRKNQGRSRYFGNREILGRIEIKDFDNHFRVVSSREGIVQNKYYKQLIRDSEKSTGKYNGFFYTTLKRLEKYVVDGLKWDSLPEEISEATIQKEIVEGTWNGQEIYKIDENEKVINSSALIKQILSTQSQNILDLYINEDLVENLIEEDKEKTKKKLEDFIKNFGSISIDKFDEKTKKALKKLTSKIDDEKLLKLYKDTLSKKEYLEEKLEQEQKTKKELYKLYKKQAVEAKRLKRQKEEIAKEKDRLRKQNIFHKSLIGQEKEQLISLQHQINHSSSRINRHIELLVKKLDKNTLQKIEKNIKVISFENEKISSISGFITKANFNLTATEIKEDLIEFIKEYIHNIYSSKEALINTEDLKIEFINANNISLETKFRPLEITMMIDNFISNSIKAKATVLKFEVSKNENNNIEIMVIDNGKGIDESVKETLFGLAETTTDGSGIGLYHIKNIVSNIKGKIFLDKSEKNGAKFIIRILNET